MSVRTDDYDNRINAVRNYVVGNLTKQHTTGQLAEIAHFSKFHFHRIFRALTGETVQCMVSRLRLESAAATLIYQKNLSITRVAVDHGFSSGANFTKAFTKHFGCSPSSYRNEKTRSVKSSKIGKDCSPKNLEYIQIEQEVSITHQSEIQLAYRRSKGAYKHSEISTMHHEVQQWVEDQSCVPSEPASIGIIWSDSHIVDEENWVYDACVAVQPKAKGDSKIGIQTLAEGHIAQIDVELTEGDSFDLSAYWDWFVGHWFVSSGYELRASPSYELYVETGKRFVVRLSLPIE